MAGMVKQAVVVAESQFTLAKMISMGRSLLPGGMDTLATVARERSTSNRTEARLVL